MYEQYPHSIQAKNGGEFVSTLYLLANPLGKLPKSDSLATLLPSLLALVSRSFPHWLEEDFISFAGGTLIETTAFSIIRNSDDISVGFNFYTMGEVGGARFMYTNYTGIDPDYRRIGLMEKSRSADLIVADLEILAGCSSVGAVHLGMHRLSDEKGRVMYPLKLSVPKAVGELGKEIYAVVNGEETRSSVDEGTLVRHGTSAYAKGVPRYQLFEELKLGPNDAVIYLSLTQKFNDELLAA